MLYNKIKLRYVIETIGRDDPKDAICNRHNDIKEINGSSESKQVKYVNLVATTMF